MGSNSRQLRSQEESKQNMQWSAGILQPSIFFVRPHFFHEDGIHLSPEGCNIYLSSYQWIQCCFGWMKESSQTTFQWRFKQRAEDLIFRKASRLGARMVHSRNMGKGLGTHLTKWLISALLFNQFRRWELLQGSYTPGGHLSLIGLYPSSLGEGGLG